MRIRIDEYMDLDIDEVRDMLPIFQLDSGHSCYSDPENQLRVYVESAHKSVKSYRIYEIIEDKGVFLLVTVETSNISLIHENAPRVDVDVAGFAGTAVTTELDAIGFMISKIKQLLESEKVSDDLLHAGSCMRKKLLVTREKV